MNNLLNDTAMEHFVVNGFAQVQSTLPASVHESAHENTRRAFRNAASMEDDRIMNPANNILPMVPELQDVLDDPAVTGALTSIFGCDYLVHPHRHCHPNFAVPRDRPCTTIMGIHKDGHADGNPKPRHRVPRWGLLFYNPHACPEELGPTCITPQSHIYHRITNGGARDRNVAVEPGGERLLLPGNYVKRDFLPVVGELGTVSILHFDMVHSVITNVGDIARYAHKFVIMRTENPDEPSWDGGTTPWSESVPPDARDHSGYWRFLWNWLRGSADRHEDLPAPSREVTELIALLKADDAPTRLGAANELGLHRGAAATAVPDLVAALADDDDAMRVNACYALGAIGEPAIGALLDRARGEATFFAEQPILNVSEAIHALIAVGEPARPALLEELTAGEVHMQAWSAFALGELGRADGATAGHLATATTHAEPPVAKHAISALGISGRASEETEAAARALLEDEDRDKRVYAAQALIRLGASSEPTIEALARALSDPHPYVAAFAHEQLYRVGDADSQGALLRYLRKLRWFPYPVRKATGPAY